MVTVKPENGGKNHTTVTFFVLLGLIKDKKLQLVLFPIFLVTYLVTLIWNLGLIMLIRLDSQLQTPMYFFLSSLSFMDTCYSTSINPKMLYDFFKDEKTISFFACATQYFVGASMAQGECFILAAMAYDRYVAIGKPLQYSTIMSPGLCWKMVLYAYGSGILCSLAETVSTFNLYYCGSNIIPHFFCNMSEIVALACSSPFFSNIIIFLVAIFVGFGSLIIIILSYGFIAASIRKMSPGKGSSKAFNTCASHLTVVILYYGTGLAVYLHPNSGHSRTQDKIMSLFYVLLIPMLNPAIYSLRNKEIKESLKKVIKRAAQKFH
ncbi:olfactory receptor 1440-like [Suncus etruscus]|uniref:olfactory receptor 1440-like n=1 Tax=Suncus etruscus TaxID=109475 RepID=UPI00210F77AF|nr:olfactory receptor 1440-like [Suncus etruscus]